MKSEHIPKATIARLATYIQVLSEFKREGTDVVSSEPVSYTHLDVYKRQP